MMMDWTFLVGTEWIALLCFDNSNDSLLTDSERKQKSQDIWEGGAGRSQDKVKHLQTGLSSSGKWSHTVLMISLFNTVGPSPNSWVPYPALLFRFSCDTY